VGEVPAAREPRQDGGYEVRVHWSLDRTWRVFAVIVVTAALGFFGPEPWPVGGWSSCATASWAVLLAVADYVRLRRRGCLLRVDGAGLTVGGWPTVPWSEVRKAEVGRRGVVVFFSWGADDTLPLLTYESRSARNERRRRRQLTARFGSPMVLPARLYGIRPAEVMAAVHAHDGRASLFR
jgi:hypothetical protein